jgi:hypothetical protein
MANVNRPFGLRPVQYLNGSPWNGQARVYSIAHDYATALYIGDPVISSGTSDDNGIQGITIAGVSGAIRGVIVGIGRYKDLMANPGNLDRTYFPANGDGVAKPWYAMVVDDPNVLFEIQEESNGTQIAAAQIGLNTVLKSGTGNGYMSGWMLPSVTGATPATTATLQVRLMGLVQRQDNAFGAYAKHLIKINVHELGTGTGAAGV